MSDSGQDSQRESRRNAILAAQTSAGSLPEYRRDALQAQFESATSRAQMQVEYVRR